MNLYYLPEVKQMLLSIVAYFKFVIFDFQDVESMSTTSVTRGNINRPSHITTRGKTDVIVYSSIF
jgi:hypothetical protein